MLDPNKTEELIATAMAAEDVDGNPLQLTVRVLTDGTENAIEVTTTSADVNFYDRPLSKAFIPADSGLVAMIVSMQSMLPAST